MNATAPAFTPAVKVPRTGLTTRGQSSGILSLRTESPLYWEDGPIVWIDCEVQYMTGLDFKKDRLLEIAVIITNGNLDIVDRKGLSYIIKTDKNVLDTMDPWCIKQHGESGLTAACLASPHDLAAVSSHILSYIRSWVPNERAAVLAGNSVHADKMFLSEYMPELIRHLHYRIIDVSTIKELCRRWYPEITEMRKNVAHESNHRALDDIVGSIEELKYYRATIFKGRDMLGLSS